MELKYKSGKKIEVLDEVPQGYVKTPLAVTAPVGASWYNNGESILSGKRKSVLVKENGNHTRN